MEPRVFFSYMSYLDEQIRTGKTSTGIWWSLVAGFLAWALDLGVSYVLQHYSCSTHHKSVLHLISIVCLLIAISGCAAGFAEFRRFPPGTSEEGGSHFDRAHFQALIGITFSLSFSVVIIAGAVPRWILSACA